MDADRHDDIFRRTPRRCPRAWLRAIMAGIIVAVAMPVLVDAARFELERRTDLAAREALTELARPPNTLNGVSLLIKDFGHVRQPPDAITDAGLLRLCAARAPWMTDTTAKIQPVQPLELTLPKNRGISKALRDRLAGSPWPVTVTWN